MRPASLEYERAYLKNKSKTKTKTKNKKTGVEGMLPKSEGILAEESKSIFGKMFA